MGWVKGRRVWIALLVVSLGVNGLLGGMLARDALVPAPAVHEGGRVMTGSGGFNPRAFIAALPEDRQEAARTELREGLGELRPLFSEMVARRREMNALMRAESFDETALLASMAEIRAVRARIDAGGEAVILAIVADLDPQTRQAALEAAYSPYGRGMGRRGGPRPAEGGDSPRGHHPHHERRR